MSPLNHKRTTSSFYVAKKWQLKDRSLPIAFALTMSEDSWKRDGNSINIWQMRGIKRFTWQIRDVTTFLLTFQWRHRSITFKTGRDVIFFDIFEIPSNKILFLYRIKSNKSSFVDEKVFTYIQAKCVTNLNHQSEMIIFKSLLTTLMPFFEAARAVS